jgi:hypothetical protein
LVSKEHVPDSVYDQVRQRFSAEELVNLTLAVAAINSWNRLCISFHSVPGEYQPTKRSVDEPDREVASSGMRR